MELSLDKFKIGQQGVVKQISGEGKIKKRLYDMGVTPGADILMVRVAPLGDPIEVTIRGYQLTLRKKEAEMVVMRMEV